MHFSLLLLGSETSRFSPPCSSVCTKPVISAEHLQRLVASTISYSVANQFYSGLSKCFLAKQSLVLDLLQVP